jgi:hypothetical protein
MFAVSIFSARRVGVREALFYVLKNLSYVGTTWRGDELCDVVWCGGLSVSVSVGVGVGDVDIDSSQGGKVGGNL